MLVVQGCYTLIIDGERIPVRAGEEYFIPKGVFHGGEPLAGTRTIHAFGGRRAERATDRSTASSLPGSASGEGIGRAPKGGDRERAERPA